MLAIERLSKMSRGLRTEKGEAHPFLEKEKQYNDLKNNSKGGIIKKEATMVSGMLGKVP